MNRKIYNSTRSLEVKVGRDLRETRNTERVLAIIKGGQFKFFGLGKELFFVFTIERLLVLGGSLYKRLFANTLGPFGGFWSLGKLLTEWKELEKLSLEDLSRKADLEIPYSEIEGYKLDKKMGIARLEFVTAKKSHKFAFPHIIPSKPPSPKGLLLKWKVEGQKPMDFFPTFLESLNIPKI